MNEWKVRRQVPEHDPTYQAERERSRNTQFNRTFGLSECNNYDHTMDLIDRMTANNKALMKKLARVSEDDT